MPIYPAAGNARVELPPQPLDRLGLRGPFTTREPIWRRTPCTSFVLLRPPIRNSWRLRLRQVVESVLRTMNVGLSPA